MEKLSHWYGSDILDECKRLRKILEPICIKYHGPSDMIKATNTMYPFVLLLGNHSSGKSSFINFLLKRKIQMTGVAPTDDCFTIIGPSEEEDIDRNGPALVGDPDLGFHDLKSFGPILINHTQLKVRTNTAVKDFMIVDSPGMIDSPVSRTVNSGEDVMDRGYDFENVCRWYAERADLILLFFDPDKPGTTGETLSILTNALVGLDHKLSIVLNKADQFRRIHDFARAYGSLCWNLSKVIPRKDLPRIHTMCVPVLQKPPIASTEDNSTPALNTTDTKSIGQDEKESQSSPSATASSANRSFFDQGVFDLEEGREEVIKEVYDVPRRRVDNEISRLFESVTALQMHCELIDHIVQQYQKKLWELRWKNIGVTLLSMSVTWGMYSLLNYLNANETAAAPNTSITKADAPVVLKKIPKSSAGVNTPPPTTTTAPKIGNAVGSSGAESTVVVPDSPVGGWSGAIGAAWQFLTHHWQISLLTGTAIFAAVTTGATILYNSYDHDRYLRTFQHRRTFEDIARKEVFAKSLTSKDAFTHEMVQLILERVERNIQPEVLPSLTRVPQTVFTALSRILNEDIANLRRRASPNFPTISSITAANSVSSAAATGLSSANELDEHIFILSPTAATSEIGAVTDTSEIQQQQVGDVNKEQEEM